MKLDRKLMNKIYGIRRPGFLITKDRVYQFLSYRRTDSEYILDDYPNMPEEIRSRLHRININDVLAICRTRKEAEQVVYLMVGNSIDFVERYNGAYYDVDFK